MERAISVLQMLNACIIDDGASEVVYRARVKAFAMKLCDELGTDMLAELANQITNVLREEAS
jgi:citrate lyase gamma subunit